MAPSSSASPTSAADSRFGIALACSLVGVALLAVPAAAFRIDRVSCGNWPSRGSALPADLAYFAALALLTVGWHKAAKTSTLGLGRAFALGLVVNVAAILVPPFLSQDPLFYGAIGRALAAFHQSPFQPMTHALPASDPFFLALPENWRAGSSAYLPGFFALAWAIAKAGTTHLRLTLGLYQACALLAMAGAAYAVARALPEDQRARAALYVLLCPLTVIEASLSAHNDALLALSVGLFAWATVKGKRGAGLAALAGGLLIKASALLLVGYDALALAFAALRQRRLSRAIERAALIGAGCLSAGAIYLILPELGHMSSLIGQPGAPPSCTSRAIECTLRFGVRTLFHAPIAAWWVGIAFRVLGGLFVLGCAVRSGRSGRIVEGAALMLLGYFTFLHGWAETWYFLPLVPLLPLTSGKLRRAGSALCVSACAIYPFHLAAMCTDWQKGSIAFPVISGAIQLGLYVLPVAYVMLTRDQRGA